MTIARKPPGTVTGAFSLVEVCIGAAVLVVVMGAILLLLSGARRSETLGALYVDLLEGVSIALHQLRMDMRQLTFVPGQPLEPTSFRLAATSGPGLAAIRFRRSSAGPTASQDLGSYFVFVDYDLVPTGRGPGRLHLRRSEWTADGSPLPGLTLARQEHVHRSFALRDASFLHPGIDPSGREVLHVMLDVVSDTADLPDWGPFREKGLRMTSAIHLVRPEAAFVWPSYFAAPVLVRAEHPPGEVLAPIATHGGAVPTFEAVPAGGARR